MCHLTLQQDKIRFIWLLKKAGTFIIQKKRRKKGEGKKLNVQIVGRGYLEASKQEQPDLVTNCKHKEQITMKAWYDDTEYGPCTVKEQGVS